MYALAMSRRSHGSTIVFCIIALLLSPLTTADAHAAVGPAKDFTVPGSYSLGSCQSATELDCIESVGVVDSQGTYAPANLIQELPADLAPYDLNGNATYRGSTIWSSVAGPINLEATLDSPVTKGCNGTCAAFRARIDVPDPLSTKVRFTFRTSWLRPMNIQLQALDSNYTAEKISGGTRWMMEGMGTPISDFNFLNSTDYNAKLAGSTPADFDKIAFNFIIHHAGNGILDSYWDPKCSDVGYSVQSQNTTTTGDPTWDSQTQSLTFSIWAPHLRANAELNTGYFKFWTTDKFMDCKFPANTLTKAAKLILEITNEDGTASVATTAVSNKNGQLYFFASGFHFSSPKIMVRAELTAPTASATPMPSSVNTSAKKVTITCVKGRLKTKVIGLHPKCPSGYKKQ